MTPEVIPEGSVRHGREPFTVQELEIKARTQAFVLLQHYGCAVTQPQLLELLWDTGISISAGQLSNLLTRGA